MLEFEKKSQEIKEKIAYSFKKKTLKLHNFLSLDQNKIRVFSQRPIYASPRTPVKLNAELSAEPDEPKQT